MQQFPLFNAESAILVNHRPEEPDLIFAFTVTNEAGEATGYVPGVAAETRPGHYEIWSPGMETAGRIYRKLIMAAQRGSSSQDPMQSIISNRVLKYKAEWGAMFLAAAADRTGEWSSVLYRAFMEAVAESGSVAFSSHNSDPDADKVLNLLMNTTVEDRIRTLPTVTRWVVDHYSTSTFGGGRSQRDGRAEEIILALNGDSDEGASYNVTNTTDEKENQKR